MVPVQFKVVLEANVLYPFTLRDTLLRAAACDLYQVYWSAQILNEVTRNLVNSGIVSVDQASRLREAMSSAFPEATVTGYDALIGSMRNEAGDRHVAAAALKVGAQVIVTANLVDFRDLPNGIEALHPDVFLCEPMDLAPDVMPQIVREQASALRRPPRSFEDILRALERVVPQFAAAVRRENADLPE